MLSPQQRGSLPPFDSCAYSIAQSGGPRYLSVSAATPGNSIPDRNSSEAPPPVETWLILLVTPALLIAFSESPPPTTETAPEFATAFARATVPVSKGGISNTPIGPFQMMVF